MRTLRTVSVLAIVSIMLLTSLPFVSNESSADGEDYNGMYGATIELSTAAMNQALIDYTGKDFQAYVADFNTHLAPYGYDIEQMAPYLDMKTSFRRDVTHDQRDYEAVDHISGYVDIGWDSKATGRFPAAGTYPANENESAAALFLRVFGAEDRPEESTTTDTHIRVGIYFDISIVTHMNFLTGEITDSYLTLKAAIHDRETNNITIKIEKDDYGNTTGLTVAYDEQDVDSTFYLDLEVDLTAEDFVIGSRSAEWTITPLIVEHVNKSRVSTDLADGIWALVLAYAGDGMDVGQLPGIILKILGTGTRMLDVFETIKSLASTEIPDVGFKATFKAKDLIDTNGFHYCNMESIKDGGPEFRIPWGGYTADLTRIVKLIPDETLSPTAKDVIDAVFVGLGWNDIKVKDISEDKSTQAKCDNISKEVNAVIDSNDTESYGTPTVYTVFSAVIIAATVIALGAMFIIRRRSS